MPLMKKKKMDIGTGGQVIDLAQVMSDHRVVDVINGCRAIFFCTILNTFVEHFCDLLVKWIWLVIFHEEGEC